MGVPTPRDAVRRGRSTEERIVALEQRTIPRVSAGQLADAGDVKLTARATAPDGWLLCQGQSLLRAEYPTLFAAIGTMYGSVDGTHFTLPNLKGRAPVGLDAAQAEFDTLGETGGEKTHVLTTEQMPSHSHGLPTEMWRSGIQYTAANAGGHNFTVLVSGSTNSTGGGLAHNNLQPYIVLNYVIKT